MRFCIQDLADGATYVFDQDALGVFRVDPDYCGQDIDVLLVVPSGEIIQEVPPCRLTDAVDPTVQLVDTVRNLAWVFKLCDMAAYRTSTPPAEIDDVIWFAMPTSRELVAAVPVFRKALVQHGS